MEDEREEEEEVHFVNVIQVDGADSDEELAEEITRTEAAVDDCYLRRARRAGLDLGDLGGKPLSEEEKDELSERLGDGAGVRAKRRREIDGMPVEELEAEIEEIKRSRSKRGASKVGCLPLTLAIMCLMGGPVKAFTAYDCSNRSNIIESYSLLEPDACTNTGKQGEVETTVYEGNCADQARPDDLGIQMLGNRNYSLPAFLISRCHEVHPIQGPKSLKA
jgi:hypothetical protein